MRTFVLSLNIVSPGMARKYECVRALFGSSLGTFLLRFRFARAGHLPSPDMVVVIIKTQRALYETFVFHYIPIFSRPVPGLAWSDILYNEARSTLI